MLPAGRRLWRWACDKCRIAEHEGIKICDFVDDPAHQAAFVARTIEAIELIKVADQRRFSRVRRHISYIVNVSAQESNGTGEYEPLIGICYVCFANYAIVSGDDIDPAEVPKTRVVTDGVAAAYGGLPVISYALTLIHEATHGAVEARGIRYTWENRIRIERLCFLEETRFVERHCAWAASEVLSEPDEQAYADQNRPHKRDDRVRWLSASITTLARRLAALLEHHRKGKKTGVQN